MTASDSHQLTTQAPTKLIWQSTLPMLGAILALFSYDVLESTLVALQNEQVLAAFGFTLPITAAMTALAVGLSVRSNNKVIQKSCNAPESLPTEIVHALIATVFIVGCFSVLFFTLSDHLLALLGNEQWISQLSNTQIVSSQHDYLNWRYLGWIFIALIWQSNAMLRALGWMKSASLLMFSWMVVKSLLVILLLTPASPFYPNSTSSLPTINVGLANLDLTNSGLTNLGLIHVVTDALFAFISLVVIYKKIGFATAKVTLNLHALFHQKRHGTLVVIQQFITPISMAALTAIAAQVDASYVAALALLFRLEVLILILPMVLTTSVPTIVGANYWLGYKNRVRACYMTTFLFIIVVQLFVAVIIYSQSYILSSLICPHDDVSSHLSHYLQWVPWGYAAAGVSIVLQSCLNAKNHTIHATLLAFTHRIIFILPLAYIGITAFGHTGFYQGLMIGHLSAMIPILYLLHRFGLLNKSQTTYVNNKPIEGLQHET